MELRNGTGVALFSQPASLVAELPREIVRRTVESTAKVAEAVLARSPYLALRKVHCICRGGVLILRGRLPTFHTRQVMHALLRNIEGVERIDDETVIDPEPRH